jgi:hypothetical protein
MVMLGANLMESTPPPIPTTPPPPATPPAPPIPPRRNWWQRNWKWFVPAGCLSLLAVGFVSVALIFVAVFGMLKSSDAYKTALNRAKSDQRVTEAIGQPVRAEWYVLGNTNVSGDTGQSNLTIPIRGPKGKAMIQAVATKSEGEWKYSKLAVKIEGTGETIDLMQDSPD